MQRTLLYCVLLRWYEKYKIGSASESARLTATLPCLPAHKQNTLTYPHPSSGVQRTLLLRAVKVKYIMYNTNVRNIASTRRQTRCLPNCQINSSLVNTAHTSWLYFPTDTSGVSTIFLLFWFSDANITCVTTDWLSRDRRKKNQLVSRCLRLGEWHRRNSSVNGQPSFSYTAKDSRMSRTTKLLVYESIAPSRNIGWERTFFFFFFTFALLFSSAVELPYKYYCTPDIR